MKLGFLKRKQRKKRGRREKSKDGTEEKGGKWKGQRGKRYENVEKRKNKEKEIVYVLP